MIHARALVPVFLAPLVMLLASSSPAHADRHDDLAFEIKERFSYTQGVIITKLMTFKLGDKCWDKVLDKGLANLGRIGGYAGSIAEYAKEVTGDDWRAIEQQNSSDKELNRQQVSKLVDALGTKLHITVNVEGDDCAKDSAMWTKYLGTAVRALKDYPPKSGKAFIVINATTKAKGVKTDVSKDGTKFTITGSRDLETVPWPDEITKPFKRVSTKN